MFYNAIKINLIKLKYYFFVCINDLFTPFYTILTTILFVITSLCSYIYRNHGAVNEVDDNILIGIISSSLVAIVIESQSNLRFNIRRHNELVEYFLELSLLESALDKSEKKDYDIDSVEIIWSELPNLVRVLKDVNESKLEWLTSIEARAIQNILIINREICYELGRYIENEVEFYETDFLLKQNIIGQTISDMPKEMFEGLIRQKKREDIDKLVQSLFFEGICANYGITKNVNVIGDYFVGKPSIDSVDKNILSERCYAILQEVRILFPYLKYEQIHLTMEIVKQKKNK